MEGIKANKLASLEAALVRNPAELRAELEMVMLLHSLIENSETLGKGRTFIKGRIFIRIIEDLDTCCPDVHSQYVRR